MHTLHLLRRSIGIASLLSLLPSLVFASTLQQDLAQSLKTTHVTTPLRIDGEATVRVQTTPRTRQGSRSNGSLHFTLIQRILSRDIVHGTTEGRIAFDDFTLQTPYSQGTQTLLSKPIALNWKSVGQTYYVKLEELPIDFKNRLGEIDLSLIENQWISIDIHDAIDALQEESASGVKISRTLFQPNNSFVYMTGVEKRFVNPAGHHIVRLKARVHTGFTNTLQKLEITNLRKRAKKDAWYKSTLKADIREVNAKYLKMRQTLSALRLAINLDQDTKTIQRLELAGKTTQRATSELTTYTYSAGFNFNKDLGPTIEPPALSSSFEELLEKMKSMLYPGEASSGSKEEER